MADIYAKINALIDKAAHMNTPENEARSCALAACRLIKKHEIKIGATVTKDLVSDETESNKNDPYMNYVHKGPQNGIPINPEDFTQDIQQYKVVISKGQGRCESCGRQYIANTIIAEGIGTGIKTHFTCKRFFVE